MKISERSTKSHEATLNFVKVRVTSWIVFDQLTIERTGSSNSDPSHVISSRLPFGVFCQSVFDIRDDVFDVLDAEGDSDQSLRNS